MYKFTVPGRPVPAQRMTRKGKWNERSRRSLDYQAQVAWEAKAARVQGLKGALTVSIDFYFADKRHGDIDNHIKAILDGLQYGRAFENDKQIMRVEAEIFYDDEERAEICISSDTILIEAYKVGKAILDADR